MKKSLIAAVAVLFSVASFAQAPAAKPAKKEKAKTEAAKPAADTTKKAAPAKKAAKAEKPAKKGA